MKITRQKVWRALAWAFMPIGLFLLVGLGLVDYAPYFRTPYYQATLSRLEDTAATNKTVHGNLSAGFGRAKLTPALNAPRDDPSTGTFRQLPLAGYGNRSGKPATGVHDDLYIKAAAIRVNGRTGVMIGADALIIPREVADIAVARLAKEWALQREQVYFSATHSHCSIGGWGEGMVAEAFSGGFNPASREWFANCLVRAVQQALTNIQPALFGRGSFQAPQFIRNRLVGKLGRVDPEFSYLVLKQIGGRTAVLGSYSAHATVLSGKVMEWSADYPGYWQRRIEEETGGPAIFLAGGVGSQGPVAPSGNFEGAEKMGKALADELLKKLPSTPLTNEIPLSILGVDISMPPLGPRLTDGIRLRPWLARAVLPAAQFSYMQGFRLGDSIWISTPCDISGEIALAVKDSLRPKGMNAVLTSFNGDYVGYVILPRYYHMDGYEPRIMSFFGPYVPEYFDDLARLISTRLIQAPAL